MSETALSLAQALAGDDYEVTEADGFIVASFADGEDRNWLSFEVNDPEPEKRAACLDWSVRRAMGQTPPMPAWMIAAGFAAPGN